MQQPKQTKEKLWSRLIEICDEPKTEENRPEFKRKFIELMDMSKPRTVTNDEERKRLMTEGMIMSGDKLI